jgi:N-dimethylarginine dimethylaminohydrolase
MTITSVQAPVARRIATRRHFLMCPPTYFDVTYRINPWMHPEGRVDRRLAMRQWEALRQSYLAAGHTVDVIEPVEGLPDMVFAANGGFVVDGRAVSAKFRFPERLAEAPAFTQWFTQAGLVPVATSAINEGEGDFLIAGGVILAGTGFRTDREAHAEIRALLSRPVVSLELVDDRYYHLDTALAVLADDQVAYFPDAFSPHSQGLLRELFPDALLASPADAAAFGLNAVSDGLHVFLPAGATVLERQLTERGFEPHPIDVSELLKAGGGVKCCTLEIRQ